VIVGKYNTENLKGDSNQIQKTICSKQGSGNTQAICLKIS